MSESIDSVKNEKQRSLVVYSMELLYQIADAGYLEQLNEVRPDNRRPNRRIYYFDRDPDLERIIKNYQETKIKEKAETSNKVIASSNTYSLSNKDREIIINAIIEYFTKPKVEKEDNREV